MQTRRKTLPRRFTGSTKKKSYGIGGAVMTLGKNLLQGKKFGDGMFKGVLKAGVTPGSGVGAGLGLAGALAGKSKNPALQKLGTGLGMAGNVAGMFTGGGGGGALQGLAGKFAGGGGGAGFQNIMQTLGKGAGGGGMQNVLGSLIGNTVAADGMKVYASGGSIPRMKVLKSYHEGGDIPSHPHGLNGEHTNGSVTYKHEDTDRTEGSNIYSAENNINPNTGAVIASPQQKEMGNALRDGLKDYMHSLNLQIGQTPKLLQMHKDGEINLNEVPAFQDIVEMSTAGWNPEAAARYAEAMTSGIMGGKSLFALPFKGLNTDEKSFTKETKGRDFSEGLTHKDAGKTGVTLGGGRANLTQSDWVKAVPSSNWTYTEGMKEKYYPDLARLVPRPPQIIINDRGDKELMVGPPPVIEREEEKDYVWEREDYPELEPDPVGGLGEYDLGLGDLNPSDYTGSTAEQRATGPWSGETRDPRMQGIKLLKEGETQEDGGVVYAHGGRIPNRMLRQMLKKDTYRLRRKR